MSSYNEYNPVWNWTLATYYDDIIQKPEMTMEIYYPEEKAIVPSSSKLKKNSNGKGNRCSVKKHSREKKRKSAIKSTQNTNLVERWTSQILHSLNFRSGSSVTNDGSLVIYTLDSLCKIRKRK
jgi:hypothetical protein